MKGKKKSPNFAAFFYPNFGQIDLFICVPFLVVPHQEDGFDSAACH